MYDKGPNRLVRSQPPFFKVNQEEEEKEEEEWWSKKDRRAVEDEAVISEHVKHQGGNRQDVLQVWCTKLSCLSWVASITMVTHEWRVT